MEAILVSRSRTVPGQLPIHHLRELRRAPTFQILYSHLPGMELRTVSNDDQSPSLGSQSSCSFVPGDLLYQPLAGLEIPSRPILPPTLYNCFEADAQFLPLFDLLHVKGCFGAFVSCCT